MASKKADTMLSALRSAGAQGMTRDELFDAKVANPDWLAEQLREDGHSIATEPVAIPGVDGPVSGVTTRFTLMVDASTQGSLLEGERTGQLGTWKEDPAWR